MILVDYRDQFWLRTDYKECSIKVSSLANHLEKHGFMVAVKSFHELDFRTENFLDVIVIYQSSEDPGLRYKDFIEDILLTLKLQGAILIPDFHLFRAHNNKVFMELLRDISSLDEIKNLKAKVFGTYEELHSSIAKNSINLPKVLKMADGAQSKNVRLIRTDTELSVIPRRLTLSFNFYYWLVDKIKPFWSSRYPNYRRKSHRRRKFILQEFIPYLSGDFKIVIFGGKYYVLSRSIRKNDFRASGSGKFTFPSDCPIDLLNFAKTVYEYFRVPFISLDVATPETGIALLEFQFVHFGCYTLEKSPHWYSFVDGNWIKSEGQSDLEEEFARSVAEYVTHFNLTKV